MRVKRVDWVSDISRARADLQTSLGMLMGVSDVGRGTAPPAAAELEYATDALRLLRSGAGALDRALISMGLARSEDREAQEAQVAASVRADAESASTEELEAAGHIMDRLCGEQGSRHNTEYRCTARAGHEGPHQAEGHSWTGPGPVSSR